MHTKSHLGTSVEVRSPSNNVDSRFVFDTVLGPSSGQHEVFDTCGKPLVEAALNGQRACLFACA